MHVYTYTYIYIYIYIYMVFIHRWRIPSCSHRKMTWVGSERTTAEFCSDALTDWAIRPKVQLTLRANSVQLLQFHRLFSVKFHFSYCLRQSPRLFELKVSCGNHMSVAESIYLSISLSIYIYTYIYIYIYVYIYI